MGACTMLVILGFDLKKKKERKKKKKKERERERERERKGNPRTRTHANLHTVFPRYTLSPVGHRGVLLQCEEEPFDISLLTLCDKT